MPFCTCIFARIVGGLYVFLHIYLIFQIQDFFAVYLDDKENLSEKQKGEMPMIIFEAFKPMVTPKIAAEYYKMSFRICRS